MKKFFKKIFRVVLIVSIILVNFFIGGNYNNVEAKTLGQLKSELEAKEKELSQGESKKKLTEQEIEAKRKNISDINVEIDNIHKQIDSLTEEIEQLNIEIKEKEEEIKKILNYYQLSSGEFVYLEYIFDAADFTDFIYRMAITEQLSDHNDKLIDEYNQTITENEQKKKDLSNKTLELNDQQTKLSAELASLGEQLSEVIDENENIEDDIKSMKSLIKSLEDRGCKSNEDINTCGNTSGGIGIPSSDRFYRPVVSGMVSANYGIYYPWGYAMQHYGMDIAGTGHGANVYSTAYGKVAYITVRSDCGGNRVYIHHTVNGVAYTSGYFHLATINVKEGDIVTPNTAIEWWDGCSTGTHVHFQLAMGHIPAGLNYYSRFTAKHFNPRNVVNFPAEGAWFSNRTSVY